MDFEAQESQAEAWESFWKGRETTDGKEKGDHDGDRAGWGLTARRRRYSKHWEDGDEFWPRVFSLVPPFLKDTT